MSNFKVAVLGCGPAGLMAAWGAQAVSPDVDVRVFSRAQKSKMFGAQYLHEPIHGIDPGEPVTVQYKLQGTVADYREKVYGRMPFIGNMSVEALEPDHQAWDIRLTYDTLWGMWAEEIADVDIDPEGIKAILAKADLVINTIPAPSICWRGHSFRGQEIWAAGEAHEYDIAIPYYCPDNTVLCVGETPPTFYRLSNVFGHKTVEWSMHTMLTKPPVGKPSVVVKPIDTNCDCWPDVVPAGRYGTWKKGVLSHSAYNVAYHATLEGRSLIHHEA